MRKAPPRSQRLAHNPGRAQEPFSLPPHVRFAGNPLTVPHYSLNYIIADVRHGPLRPINIVSDTNTLSRSSSQSAAEHHVPDGGDHQSPDGGRQT